MVGPCITAPTGQRQLVTKSDGNPENVVAEDALCCSTIRLALTLLSNGVSGEHPLHVPVTRNDKLMKPPEAWELLPVLLPETVLFDCARIGHIPNFPSRGNIRA